MPWLVKSEPDCYSIDDLARDGATRWTGVRNYQARNFMRDGMKVGDKVLFYHSSAEPPGVAGIARVTKPADWDLTALDPKDDHFDPKATREQPIWMAVEIGFVRKFAALVELSTLRATPVLARMALLQRGQRLSVQEVSMQEFAAIEALAAQEAQTAKPRARSRR